MERIPHLFWTSYAAHCLDFSQEGRQVENIVLSMSFWNKLEWCLRASQPLLVALRIADGDTSSS